MRGANTQNDLRHGLAPAVSHRLNAYCMHCTGRTQGLFATGSQKLQKAIWGEGVVDQLARYISRCHSDLRGFERRNLLRMRQFYDAYKDHKAAVPLVRHVSWSGNLLILSRCKSPEEREFYLRLAHREGWDKRETDRQLRGALFERAVLGRPKVSPAVTQWHPAAEAIFKDSYLVDFLGLPEAHSEQELQAAIIVNPKRFLLELGRDFAFVGEQYLPVPGPKCSTAPGNRRWELPQRV